jgi:hypothetical protein
MPEQTTITELRPVPLRPTHVEQHQPSLANRLDDVRWRLEDYARREPTTAVLVALGAGLVLGKVLHWAFFTTRRRTKGDA